MTILPRNYGEMLDNGELGCNYNPPVRTDDENYNACADTYWR